MHTATTSVATTSSTPSPLLPYRPGRPFDGNSHSTSYPTVRKPEYESRLPKHDRYSQQLNLRRSFQNVTKPRDPSNDIRRHEATHYESDGPFPIEDDKPTCGVARITDLNRNGIAMRILGGREARRGRWPWQVAVLNRLQVRYFALQIV
jgi:hypothetical protein